VTGGSSSSSVTGGSSSSSVTTGGGSSSSSVTKPDPKVVTIVFNAQQAVAGARRVNKTSMNVDTGAVAQAMNDGAVAQTLGTGITVAMDGSGQTASVKVKSKKTKEDMKGALTDLSACRNLNLAMLKALGFNKQADGTLIPDGQQLILYTFVVAFTSAAGAADGTLNLRTCKFSGRRLLSESEVARRLSTAGTEFTVKQTPLTKLEEVANELAAEVKKFNAKGVTKNQQGFASAMSGVVAFGFLFLH
jgi:hypothetical protein